MGDKLKKTEEHLLRLLALRKQQGAADRARARGGGVRGRRLASATAASSSKEKAAGGGELRLAKLRTPRNVDVLASLVVAVLVLFSA